MVRQCFGLSMLVLVLVFGMMVIGCDDGSTCGNDNFDDGFFYLTNIPSRYNGKYVHLASPRISFSGIWLFGNQSVNLETQTFIPTRISNGRANIPMWIVTGSSMVIFPGSEEYAVERYFGNHTFYSISIAIFDSATISDEVLNNGLSISFELVTFSNGSVKKCFNEAL